MTLPEYDQNPVVFVANLEEVKLEVLKLSIGMYRVLVCTTACFGKKWNHFFKTGLTYLSWKNYKILIFGKDLTSI